MEDELLRSKTDLMLLNNQLLEAVQKRLEQSLELENWKVNTTKSWTTTANNMLRVDVSWNKLSHDEQMETVDT